MTPINKALPAALLLAAAAAHAQIVTDGTVGARVDLSGRNPVIPESLGLRVGNNLLHSFSTFGVIAGDRATFTGSSFLQNIIARITGGSPSRIDGTVASAVPGSNLYLVNPAGIVFGPESSIDVPGSFHASTAHYLRMADGTRIAMSATPNVTLTFAPPAAFGFEGAAAPIVMQSERVGIAEGQRLSLVGGNVTVERAGERLPFVSAFSGRIDIVATQSAGEVVIDAQGLRPQGFAAMGTATIRNAILSVGEGVSQTGAGGISITGGDVAMDHAILVASTTVGDGRGITLSADNSFTMASSQVFGGSDGTGHAGAISLRARDLAVMGSTLITTECEASCSGSAGDLRIDATGEINLDGARFYTATSGSGNAGAMSLSGRDITISGTSQLQSVARRDSTGDAGNLEIRASRDLAVSGSEVMANTFGAGDAGSMLLQARDITVSNASLVDTSTELGASGSGGLMRLNASRNLSILGEDPINSTFVVSNSFSTGNTGAIEVNAGNLRLEGNAYLQAIALASGNSSGIVVRAADISLRNGGQIDAGIRGSGRGGTVDVAATGSISIDGIRPNLDPLRRPGIDVNLFPSGIFSSTRGFGQAGSVVISARTLDITGGGQVASTAGVREFIGDPTATGNGGSVSVTASERITVRGFVTSPEIDASAIVANAFARGDGGSITLSAPLIQLDSGRIQTQSEGGGNGGAIHITGGDLSLSNRAQIASTQIQSGHGGSIAINLTGTLTVSDQFTGIYAATQNNGGDAGNIAITARNALLTNFGQINAGTRNQAGSGGSITMQIGERLAMSDGASVAAETYSASRGGKIDLRSNGRIELSGGASIGTTSFEEGRGDAGAVRVEARDAIALTGGASIASESFSTGIAGRVDVTSGGILTLSNDARITTAARSSDGGDINISAVTMLIDSARVTTEVGTGQGGGGNMEIRVPTLVMRDGLITANAFGGPGGNIHVGTTTFIPSADSRITASSQLGVDGVITLESPALDPTGELLVPALAFLDAGAVLAGRCGPRLAGRASSLVIAPLADAPDAPDGWRALPSFMDPAWSRPLACLVTLASAS